MNQEQFESLIKSLEKQAARDPRFYRARLGALALLGYGYLCTVLLVLMALIGVLVLMLFTSARILVLKLGWVLVVFVWGVLKAMWVKLDPPEGRFLTRSEAPELYSLIDEFRRTAQAPQVHSVIVTEEFNAAIVQHSRLGVFGWAKNYLILGLPLMQALTPDEFKAVVAHELGHLSGAHGKFGAWIYRLRAAWSRLSQALVAQQHWGTFLFVPFFRWYGPRFSAYSFVQARQQEYEADRASVRAVGPSLAASALLRVELQGAFVRDEYWESIGKRAEHEPQPIAMPYQELREPLRQNREPHRANYLVESALNRKTGYTDTHPSLADRLAAIGCGPFVPQSMTQSAASYFLGKNEADLAAGFDQTWHERIAEWWQKRHAQAIESRRTLSALNQTAAQRELTEEEAWDQARLTEECEGTERVLALVEGLLTRAPEHVGANFAYGRLLLKREEASGIGFLEKAGRLNQAVLQPAYGLIIEYLRRQGRDEEAKSYIAKYLSAGESMDEARMERSQLLVADTLIEHAVEAEVLSRFTAALAKFDDLAKAYLVRKKTQYFTEMPMYVLGVEVRRKFWELKSAEAAADLVRRLSRSLECPGETLIVSVTGRNQTFRSRFKLVPQSLIYARK